MVVTDVESALNATGMVVVLLPLHGTPVHECTIDGSLLEVVGASPAEGYRIARACADSARVGGQILVVEMDGARMVRETMARVLDKVLDRHGKVESTA